MKRKINSFAIEKGVPLPPETRGRSSLYGWAKMEVGDSILVKCEATDKDKQSSIRTAAYSYGFRNKCKFVTRIEAKGVRVWRTA